jgi:hypothetical protein
MLRTLSIVLLVCCNGHPQRRCISAAIAAAEPSPLKGNKAKASASDRSPYTNSGAFTDGLFPLFSQPVNSYQSRVLDFRSELPGISGQHRESQALTEVVNNAEEMRFPK